jgi:hypothetical protein
MDLDFYDEDLPEVRLTWAESLAKSKDTLKLVGALIGVPALLSAASFTAVYFINKKIGPS